MTDANTVFSTEETLSQARSNATAFFLTAIIYLKERGLAVEGFVAFFGRHSAPGSDELRGQPVVEAARTATLNAVSVGSTLGSLSGDEASAEVTITGWPEGEGISSLLGLGQNDSDAIGDSF